MIHVDFGAVYIFELHTIKKQFFVKLLLNDRELPICGADFKISKSIDLKNQNL